MWFLTVAHIVFSPVQLYITWWIKKKNVVMSAARAVSLFLFHFTNIWLKLEIGSFFTLINFSLCHRK